MTESGAVSPEAAWVPGAAVTAEILCVGTELLIGQTVNTNATWIARELASLGISVLWVTTVGDNWARLADALERACARADLVVTTGGLGPTADDITIEAIARLMDQPLAERQEVRDHIERVFAMRRRPLSPTNYKMALFPPSADLIRNPAGTAFGLSARHGRAWIMSFPGVPMELKEMWTDWAKPRLAAAGGGTIHSVLLRYVGIGEAQLAEQVADLLEGANPSVAPYAGDAEVHLRVTARAASKAEAEAMMEPVLARLRAIAPYFYGEDDVTLPAAVGRLLAASGQTVAAGESCTGGLLTSRLTDVAGASRYVRGAIVAYMTPVKTDLLGVDAAEVEAHGVVSEAVAIALAARARAVLGADWGVGITGWAGAAPDLPAEDQGRVWVAVDGPGGPDAQEWRFGGFPREVVKQRATQAALDHLRRRLITACSPGT